VVRVSLLYGPSRTGRPSLFDSQLAALGRGRPLALFDDEWRSPLDLPTASRMLLAIARSDFAGLLHLGGPERMTRLEMGCRFARCLGLSDAPIRACGRNSTGAPEPRPRDTSLDSTRCRQLFPEFTWPTLEQAVQQMEAA
jgi:dTDP-4-dehydrorhamnose reductase